jgi:hypothetical protein
MITLRRCGKEIFKRYWREWRLAPGDIAAKHAGALYMWEAILALSIG